MLSKNVIMLVMASACWGVGMVISKNVLTTVPPLSLLVIQLLASLLFLWTAVFLQRIPISFNRQLVRLAMVGVLNPGLAYTFGLLGLALTTVSNSTLIWAAEPPIILLLAWFVLRERPSWPVIILSLVAVGGALLATGIQGGGGTLFGNLLVFIGVLCCAVYTIFSRRAVETVDPLILIAVQQAVAIIWALAIWSSNLSRGELTQLAALEASVWLWAVVSGIVYYGLAFWFYVTGLKQTSASLAGLSLNLIPLFGLSGAYLFLAERLSAAQLLGAFVTLIAVSVATYLNSREETAKTAVSSPKLTTT
jgi:drug/metabolite transporter (DMT)-like permease